MTMSLNNPVLSFDLARPAKPKSRPPSPPRVPRLARLLALAIKFDGLIRHGTIRDYATLARLGHVSRARISQVMALLLLAPDIQEEILFLAPAQTGREPITLRHLQPIAVVASWARQPGQSHLKFPQITSRSEPLLKCLRSNLLASVWFGCLL